MPDTILLDTAPLRDQRSMVDVDGPDRMHRTIQDVEQAWERWASREGLPTRRRRGDWSTDLRPSRKTVLVYISGGKWIGDCPDCRDGIAAWPMHEAGCCLGCGTIYRLEYPPVNEIPRIVELLQARPEEQRHYHWHRGETVESLERENAVWQYSDSERGSVDLATIREALSPAQYDKLLRTIRGHA